MKRMLLTGMVLVMLLTACAAPVQHMLPGTGQNGYGTCDVYEVDFDVKRLSGWPFEGWDVVYSCNGKEIKSGHQVLLSVELFLFYPVQVKFIERDNPGNSFTETFPVAICDGGSGKTEITVTGSNGKTTTFKVSCQVTQVGRQ